MVDVVVIHADDDRDKARELALELGGIVRATILPLSACDKVRLGEHLIAIGLWSRRAAAHGEQLAALLKARAGKAILANLDADSPVDELHRLFGAELQRTPTLELLREALAARLG